MSPHVGSKIRHVVLVIAPRMVIAQRRSLLIRKVHPDTLIEAIRFKGDVRE
jgi:hypothetical protein